MTHSEKLSVHCGYEEEGFKSLQERCKKEAKKLLQTINIPDGGSVEVPFWTKGIPELICLGIFRKNENGEKVFELDFSQSTL